MESRQAIWATVGVGLLGLGVVGLIGVYSWASAGRSFVVLALLWAAVGVGGYALAALLSGLPLPATRTQPFWRGRRLHFQWPILLVPVVGKPNPPSPEQVAEHFKDRRATELRNAVAVKFADLPVRQKNEIRDLFGVVKWAIEEPLGAVLTGNDAIDIPVSGARPETAKDQLFHMPLLVRVDPTSANQNHMGIVKADETLATLLEVHKRLLRLIDEVRHDKDYWLGLSDTKRY